MIKLTRRGFFKGAVATIGAAVVAPLAVASEIMNINVEHGFTWFIKDKIADKSLDKIIRETLAKNNKLIASNLSKNNALLLKIKDKTVRINVEKISPEFQLQRMREKFDKKYVNKHYSESKESLRYNYCDDIEYDTKTQQYFPSTDITKDFENIRNS